MNRQSLIDPAKKNSQAPTKESSEGRSKIDAVCRLDPHFNDDDVLDLLVREAIDTDSRRVREAAIKTLKENPIEANRRFCRIARCSENPTDRRGALICLSLMECRNAKTAVLQGLNDPHRSVRIAAAVHIGLYNDPDVIDAFELFFERDRPFFIMDGVCSAFKPLVPLMKKIGKTCGRRLGHHDLTEAPNALDKKFA